MVTYREDDDLVEVFDGSAYKAVGGLVDVKSVLKTDTFSASVTAGNNVAVTDLSITHEVADASNKLIITAFFGQAASSLNFGEVGIAVHDGTSLIGIGTSPGNRTAVSAGGKGYGASDTVASRNLSTTFVYTPGAGSKTYTVRAINVDSSTRTIYVNRAVDDTDNALRARGISALIIQEVSV
jgi:hypothetical protein